MGHRTERTTKFRIGPITLFIIYQWCLPVPKYSISIFLLMTPISYRQTTPLKSLELTVNAELHKLYIWLTSNKLNLNIKKSYFVIFCPYQKTKRLSFQQVLIILEEYNNNIYNNNIYLYQKKNNMKVIHKICLQILLKMVKCAKNAIVCGDVQDGSHTRDMQPWFIAS